jgi:mono/diheme cytochrome c family protein
VTARKCKQCHGDDMSGTTARLPDTQTNRDDTMAFSSNLTPDVETGLGDWSDDEITRAMREGYQRDDHPMCEPMPTFTTMSDKEVADIIAYLRSLPAVVKKIPESTCPSMPK